MKEIENHIFGIFPIPLYTTKLKRNFSDKENKYVKQIQSDVYKNQNNLTSNNNYVLNNESFKFLKNELTDIVKDYFNKIIDSSNDIEPYITQSWLNYTKENEFHHRHEHPNSIVSGVLYVNADKNDQIIFYNNVYQQIRFKIKNYNIYNGDAWHLPVETYKVILFPSSLSHGVEIKKGKNTRISLAFNTFVKGTIGDDQDLTKITLK